jgi:hypothetical protein
MASLTNGTHSRNDTIDESSNVCNNNETNFESGSGRERRRVPLLPSWFVIQLTVTASLGGCLFGYDMGAISGTLPQLTNTFDLNDHQKELGKCVCAFSRHVFRLVRFLNSHIFETIYFPSISVCRSLTF